MATPSIGVQLIVYRGREQEDLAGVLGEVAKAGYQGIEAGNLSGIAPASEVRQMLADHGLVMSGVHTGYGDLADPNRVQSHLDFLRAVDAKYLICSGVAQGEGIEPYQKAADTFNRVGEQCRQAGLVFCYHNHDWEFKVVDGVKAIHRLAEMTDPALVRLCIDVYWVTMGGEVPREFIARYADRAPYFHFKDGAKGSFIELGRGTVDLPTARDAALEAGADWIVAEQDRSDKDPGQSIAESRDYMRTRLGL
jgi:sugar phosphate isomerase/epimerase